MNLQKITTNAELLRIANSIVADWSGVPGATLRLFKNDITPSPAIELADLTECDFTSYVPRLLTGDLAAPVKVTDGYYESVSSVYSYTQTAAGVVNDVYGSYVLFGGVVVALTYFAEPVLGTKTGIPFQVQLRLAVKSESLF